MSYIDYFLRFEDEAAMKLAFDAQFYDGPVNEPYEAFNLWQAFNSIDGQHAAVDVIGVIHRPTGATLYANDPDGNQIAYPEMAPIPGWHVNVRIKGPWPAELDQFVIDRPNNPARLWA